MLPDIIQNAWLRLGGWMDAVALHEVQVPGHAVQQKGNQRKRVLLGECGVDLRKLVRIAAPVTRRDLHAHQYRLRARSSTQLDHLAEAVLQCAERLPAETIVATQLSNSQAAIVTLQQRGQPRPAAAAGLPTDAGVNDSN